MQIIGREPPKIKPAGRHWPMRPGPQAENAIAATAAEQLLRAHQPRPKVVPRRGGRRYERLQSEMTELRRLVSIALLRTSRGAA